MHAARGKSDIREPSTLNTTLLVRVSFSSVYFLHNFLWGYNLNDPHEATILTIQGVFISGLLSTRHADQWLMATSSRCWGKCHCPDIL